MEPNARPPHSAHTSVHALRTTLVRVGVALVVLIVATGCLEPVYLSETGRPIEEFQCPENLDMVLVHDKEPWESGYGSEYDGEWTRMPPEEATRYRAQLNEKEQWEDDYLGDRATMEAERDDKYRREEEDSRKDAIRSCILAGNHPNLCELDPFDPYGTNSGQ